MNASKVTISQETRARLDNPALSPTRKRALKAEMVKEYIRDANGKKKTKQQLIAAAGYSPVGKGYTAGFAFITGLCKRGIISHNDTKSYKKVWIVNEAPVSPSPKEVAEKIVSGKAIVELKEFKMDKITLTDMAKQFAWSNNSDSLREFIAYVENAIK